MSRVSALEHNNNINITRTWLETEGYNIQQTTPWRKCHFTCGDARRKDRPRAEKRKVKLEYGRVCGALPATNHRELWLGFNVAATSAFVFVSFRFQTLFYHYITDGPRSATTCPLQSTFDKLATRYYLWVLGLH